MPVAPAYEIPLTQSEKVALGELCVIQGQIEYLMNLIMVVIASRKVPHGTSFSVSPAWEKKMHAMLGVAVQEWIKQIRQEAIDDDILHACEGIYRDIDVLCEDRNDFVHATYGVWLDIRSQPNTVVPLTERETSIALLPSKGVAAKRSKTNRARAASELLTVRDQVAEISTRLYAVMMGLMNA